MSEPRVELTIRRQGHPDMTVPLPEGSIHIGRAEDNGLVLPDIAVSRRHARLSVNGGAVVIEDVGSGNGTYFGGKPLRRRDLCDGDEVLIDPFTLVFSIPPVVQEVESTESPATPEAPPRVSGVPRLVLVHGHGLKPEYPIREGGLSLGRSEQRDVILPDPAASRSHAEIVKVGDDWLLRDFGSVNGTYVNARRVREHILEDGDRVRVGATELCFQLPRAGGRPEAAAPAAPPPAPSPGTRPFENLIEAGAAPGPFVATGPGDLGAFPPGERTAVPYRGGAPERPAPRAEVAPQPAAPRPAPAPPASAPPLAAKPPSPALPPPATSPPTLAPPAALSPPPAPAPPPISAPPPPVTVAPPAPYAAPAAPPAPYAAPAVPPAPYAAPAPSPFGAPVGAPVIAPVPFTAPVPSAPVGFASLAPPPRAAVAPPPSSGGFGQTELNVGGGTRGKGRRMKMSSTPGGRPQGTFMQRNIRKLIAGFALGAVVLFGIGLVSRSMGDLPSVARRAAPQSGGSEVSEVSSEAEASKVAVDQLLSQGNAYFAEKKYFEAVEKYAAVQKLSPSNATATKMGYHACEFLVIQSIYTSLAQRTQSMAQAQEAYQRAMQQAGEALAGRGNTADAIAALESVRGSFPDDQALVDTISRLRSRAAGAVVAARKRAQEQHEASIGELFSAAQSDRSRGDAMAAIQGFERVLGADPNKQSELYWKAEEQIRQIKSELSARGREAYREGLASSKSGDYLSARNSFRETLRLDPFNQVAERRLEEVQAKLDQLAQKFWSEAEIYERTNQLDMAIGRYRKVIEYSASASSSLSQKAKKRIDALMQ